MDRLTNNSDLIVRRLHPGERKEIGNHLLRLDEIPPDTVFRHGQ